MRETAGVDHLYNGHGVGVTVAQNHQFLQGWSAFDALPRGAQLDAQFLQTKLDSALALAQARDELVNLFYAQEEKKIVVEQSAYEAPAMKRQAELDYERAQRSYDQAKKNYVTKTQQSIAKAQAAEVDLMKEKRFHRLFRDFAYKDEAPTEPDGTKKIDPKKIAVRERISSFQEVVTGYTGEEAIQEAARCLRCDVKCTE